MINRFETPEDFLNVLKDNVINSKLRNADKDKYKQINLK
jgi:hypothetical protein